MPSPDALIEKAKLSEVQAKLARHALGLEGKRKRSYRNRYVAHAGCANHDDWMGMVTMGLATVHTGEPWMGDLDVFRLTRAGAEAVLRKGESLCSEDFPTAARALAQQEGRDDS